ncbi:hypothetical protein ACQW02_12540 [Humitalea sp. 24SJ18S-53]|uniref:hypothetical protein n=1 Tax=Humitalea sp. 24SJ18S-53 TaxID=3422307 RepID=UPI003D66F0D8
MSVSLWSVMGRHLAPTLVVNILVAAVMMATLVVGPFSLSRALGLEARHVGFIVAVGPAISIFCGVPSGRLVDLWGSRRVLAIGLILLTVGAFPLALLALVPNTIGVVGYVLSIVVLTPGYQLFQAANNTAVLIHNSLGPEHMPSGSAVPAPSRKPRQNRPGKQQPRCSSVAC